MPTPTYIPLATYTVAGAADNEVIFSSIPASFRDLILVFSAAISGGSDVRMEFNADDDVANYSRVVMSGNGSGTFSATVTPKNITYYGSVAPDFGTAHIIQIFDYAQTNKHKTALVRANRPTSGVDAIATRWANLTAINQISLAGITGGNPPFSIGSTFSLYGVN